jgi:hypothetical protein
MPLAIFISIALIFFTLSLHYIVFRQVSAILFRWGCPCYRGLVLAVTAITLAHVVEAAAFAIGFWGGDVVLDIGSFNTAQAMSWMDYFYFSLVNFTTLGRGDIAPTGHLRLLAAIEAFVGFLMITASGTYVLQVMAGKPPRIGVKS